MSRVELTDTQADALRMLVGDARAWDGLTLTLARGSDRNARTINSKVANVLAGHDLVEIIDGDGMVVEASPADPAPAGHLARATDEGHAWVKFDVGVAAATGVTRRTCHRWALHGMSIWQADRAAVALLHPLQVWGADWHADLIDIAVAA